ncbi:MAG: flippase [Patescibacteria group bacterium]|jgi:O-antigen/teichoic acid export membrane protein
MKVINIAKNTSYFTLALILQKVISFSYFIIIARSIGPENLGKYYFAVSFTTVFAIFVDIGMSSVLIREIAKRREKAGNYLQNIIGLKLILSLLSFGTVFALINLMGYPELTKHLVYLSSIAMILDSFTLVFFGVSRGFHNLSWESFAVVFYQVIILILGITFLQLDLSLRWLISAIAIASILNFIYSGSLILFKWRLKLMPRFDGKIVKQIITMALPFALFGIFQRFYTYFDSILLSILAGDTYVGLYSVAFKMTFALQFLPLAFVASLYPAMSAYYVDNKQQLVQSFERAMNYLIIIALPISCGIIFLAEKIILIFKSEYSGSILPLQIIIASLIFIFASYPVGSLLNACDRQKINSSNMAIVLAVSIAMNLILIPQYQAVGASITVLTTNALLLILGMVWVPKIIEYKPRKNLKVFFKSAAAAALMSVFLFYYKEMIDIWFIVPLGGLIYFGFLYMIKGYTKEDALSIVESFTKK